MKMRGMVLAVVVTLVAVLCLSLGAYAQGGQDAAKTPQAAPNAQAQPNPNPVSSFQKFGYTRIKGILTASAEKMPEENYNFKPTDAVRSYGQIIGHLADAQYLFCSAALGEKNPGLKIEQTKTTRADLIAALKEAIAYCDKAYDTMTDATAEATCQDLARWKLIIFTTWSTMETWSPTCG
jgi:hypothetical protein